MNIIEIVYKNLQCMCHGLFSQCNFNLPVTLSVANKWFVSFIHFAIHLPKQTLSNLPIASDLKYISQGGSNLLLIEKANECLFETLHASWFNLMEYLHGYKKRTSPSCQSTDGCMCMRKKKKRLKVFIEKICNLSPLGQRVFVCESVNLRKRQTKRRPT